jgi:hypothetical protein
MKVGDVVKHRGFGKIFLVAKLDPEVKNMVGVYADGLIQWIAKSWLEVISER